MVFFKFAKEIFTLRPAIALTISGLFFLAGVLELFSMAMVLPVLMGLFDSNQDMGTAGRLIEMMTMPRTMPAAGRQLLQELESLTATEKDDGVPTRLQFTTPVGRAT